MVYFIDLVYQNMVKVICHVLFDCFLFPSHLSNTPTNLCMALLNLLLFCFVLYCYAFVQYCYLKSIQYIAMHKFVGVLDNPLSHNTF